MSKTQLKLKERIEKAKAIYEEIYQEYLELASEKRWNYSLQKRICAKIQLELSVSERKAKEYVRLVESAKRYFPTSEKP